MITGERQLTMVKERRNRTPSQVAVVIGVFFVAYGVYAMWLAGEPHRLYATGSWTLALMWFGLAWASRKGTRP